MLIKFLKFIFIILVLFSSPTMAKPTFSIKSKTLLDNLIIQIGNLSHNNSIKIPKHDFLYVMTIPDSESHTGDPLVGLCSPDNRDVYTSIFRNDGGNINVDLIIRDPAIGKRIIWQGKIIYNKSLSKVSSFPEIVDQLHYKIKINIIQPSAGRPQFIIGIISI